MKVKKIVFATGNPNKLNEIKSAINGFEIVGLKDLGITEEIPETGNTLKKNALQKAKYVYDKTSHYPLTNDAYWLSNFLIFFKCFVPVFMLIEKLPHYETIFKSSIHTLSIKRNS